jgi:hypothetical protein
MQEPNVGLALIRPALVVQTGFANDPCLILSCLLLGSRSCTLVDVEICPWLYGMWVLRNGQVVGSGMKLEMKVALYLGAKTCRNDD